MMLLDEKYSDWGMSVLGGEWPSVFGFSLYIIGEVESGYNNFAVGGDCAMSK
jgi:hypothetical protein